ncbi:MAG: type II 3-dehydroquinate dehydratase [Burkholderiaceae bacterium]|nr:type II 3-dehydroquinate dehydratase [Burkholderiaceae bacterium]
MSLSPLIWVLHGPNLNRLGSREPEIYGATTLDQINESLLNRAKALGVRLDCFQTNHEGAMIERIHHAPEQRVAFMLINPAAFTHTSVAIRDAIASVAIPFVEIHISNVHRREPFRHHSYFSDLAEAVICGLGPTGYLAALDFAAQKIGIPRG